MAEQETHETTPAYDHTDPTQIFPFLDLPAEIRNMIYSYIFAMPGHKLEFGCIYPAKSTLSAEWKLAGRWRRSEDAFSDLGVVRDKVDALMAMNLLRACRQIHNEAHHLPYTTNLFTFHHSSVFHRFCLVVGAKRKLIQQIEFGVQSSFQPFDHHQEDYYELPNLRMLHMSHQCALLQGLGLITTDIEFELVYHALGCLQNHLNAINRLQWQKSAIAVPAIHLRLRFTIPFDRLDLMDTIRDTVADECKDKFETKQWKPLNLFDYTLRFQQRDEQTLDCVLDLRKKDPKVGIRVARNEHRV